MQKLIDYSHAKGPLCIGLDTDASYFPPEVKDAYESESECVKDFNLRLVDATASFCACYKVQIAYYEAMGVKGLSVYSDTLRHIRAAGAIAIADIKRGDISATAKAYAKAHFSGDFEADIVTLNPYMGFDTIQPWLEYKERGAFILTATSNPGASDIQRQKLSSLKCVRELLFPFIKSHPSLGAVVGATCGEDAKEIREALPNTFFLIPGYGAQGGELLTVKVLLGALGGVVNSSRAILKAWTKTLAQGSWDMEKVVKESAKAAKASQEELKSLCH